ncbi:amidase domain-containing protein [Streptomyces sp. NPDC058171]
MTDTKPSRTTSLRTLAVVGITATALTSGTAVAAGPSVVPAGAPASGSSAAAVSEETVRHFADVAKAVIERRTAALLDTPGTPAALSDPLATRTRGPVHLSAASARAENATVGELQHLKAELAEVSEAYTAAQTTTAVDSVDVVGDTATVQLTEDTALTYKKIHGDEPPTTEFRAEHQFVYALAADGTWALTAADPVNKSGPAPINQVVVTDPADLNTPEPADEPTVEDGTEDPNDVPDVPPGTGEKPVSAVAAPTAADLAAARKDAPASGVVTPLAGYDYGAMARYAEKYWKNYNSAYRKFNGKGGDCTNFVSQSLRAGGWKNKSGWYKNAKYWWYNSANQTYSWTSVNHWATFAKKSGRTSILGNVYQMGYGDVLQMDFDRKNGKDHTMITTHRAKSQPYLTYHSSDTYRRSMASIVKQYPKATYYAHRT